MSDYPVPASRPFWGYVDPNPCSNPQVDRPIGELIEKRLNRREMLRNVAVLASGAVVSAGLSGKARAAEPKRPKSSLSFEEISHGLDRDFHVAPGHELQVLARWGDPLEAGAGAFDVRNQTPAEQCRRFGYNCDFIAFVPLPAGSKNSDRGLLCVNHEYTDCNLMFPGLVTEEALAAMPREWVDVEMASLGHSVVEVERMGAAWRTVPESRFNRRLNALNTEMAVSGPAKGHHRMRTSADPTGQVVIGTLNNCAGGTTPWGTVLICEENFDEYFSGDPAKVAESPRLKRYGFAGVSAFHPAWAKHHSRFDLAAEPNECNRFGWIVEYDPHDPESVPVKRTALGRFKHEGACVVLNHDGRVVVYSGDDERFDYLYKFVTKNAYDPSRPAENRNLLDEGVLYVAKFQDDGRMTWLPLVHGQGPLTAANGFADQADVVVYARMAADLLQATPMDRPEDVEASPVDGKVFVILTNNAKRTPEQVDAANPRPKNAHGHILELSPPERGGKVDHGAVEFGWSVFIRCGDPKNPAHGASYHPDVTTEGWLTAPDNGAFDQRGRLWIATDNGLKDARVADGVYACDVSGDGRGLTRLFFVGPRGAEVSGLCFTPDDRTLFVSVQHPGEEAGSNFDAPSTRWPDFNPAMPPRPAVVAITRRDGQVIGT